MIWGRIKPEDDWPRDLRGQMISDTNKFLSWALHNPDQVPRIPRRRVDEGGFSTLLQHPGAKALVQRWWNRVFEIL